MHEHFGCNKHPCPYAQVKRWNDEYEGWYSKAQVTDSITIFEACLSDENDKYLLEKFTVFKLSLAVAPNPVEVEIDPA
ncbi:hypothetical protein L2729_15610 [Shewanella gelidimarina]|uniref:hypothetical protein n=1 Tax=Shewanella gelidimarina TaxID=56813 RepID=UPI00200EF6EF|nr:hypothetical protein [Shewanella gelidimarina]MCL1059398.1 hypothetical protein [Shewanella gelidimarina]